ncbi:response regulator transcription factor [Alkalilimnicola sp. S0819]|uniref:response regulator transcription factor n=1 Tax=Alkalilimnicola sp. S0819 TaxID=2613922 RepID=UPI00126280D5|nr:response regulator transcription factor [Alkalilimnicola sp. S0819]KAB7623921.1 response regulator transcription factor [Alkalilimnicola sp. S0819]MPQ16517.1 response regulator [Alkalilimnicola sp. S0819]
MRVLIVEDEAELARQLQASLQAQGWRVSVSGDGREGLYLAREYPHDLAVVDLGLPELPGLELIRTLRAEGNTLPILVLTARGRWQDKVDGLEAGADDYLTKPFHPEELLARLRALSRRSAGLARELWELDGLLIDLDAQQVSLHGESVALTAFEYRLLEHLARHAGRVLSKQALADYLYPHDEDRDSNVIEVLVARLRKKLAGVPLETLRGRGYRLGAARP